MAVHFDADKGRHIVKISMSVDGKQIRKTKMLPAGMGYEDGLAFEQRMLARILPHHDLRAALKKLHDGPMDYGWIYAAVSGNGPVKIGLTRKNVYARIRSFNTAAVEPWREIGSVHVKYVAETEQIVHASLVKQRIHMNRELFAITEAEAVKILGVVADEVEFANPLEVGFRRLEQMTA